MFCPSCGQEVPDSAKFCKFCGGTIQEGAQPAPGDQQPPAQQQPQQPMQQPQYQQAPAQQYAPPGMQAQAGEGKDWLITLLLAIFLGGLGIHRFYTGHTVIGIVQLLTAGGCGIWALIDIITIATGSFKDANGNALVKK